MVIEDKVAKGKKLKIFFLDGKRWLWFFTAVYFGGGFYVGMYVVEKWNESKLLPNKIGSGCSLETSPRILCYLNEGFGPVGFISEFIPLYFIGVLSFLAILFLPRISKTLDSKFGEEHISWSRGLVGGFILLILYAPMLLVPETKVGLFPWLVLLTGFGGFIIGLWQTPLRQIYATNLSLGNRKQLFKLEIDKLWRVSALLFPFLIAIVFVMMFQLGFIPPLNAARQTSAVTAIIYTSIGIFAMVFHIGLRLHFAYNELMKLLSKEEPINAP